MTTRFPDEIMDPKVGQSNVSEGVASNGGTKARSAMPAEAKFLSQTVMSMPSELVNKMVKTTLISPKNGANTFVGILV